MQIYFHLGLERTGSTYLQNKVFPYLEGIQYIPKGDFRRLDALIPKSAADKILVTHEFDEEFFVEVNRFHEKYPDAIPIICLREHSDWLISSYKRAIKNGEDIDFESYFRIKAVNGAGAAGSLNFYDKLVYLEQLFGTKPILFFYHDLDKYPKESIQKLADSIGASVDVSKVDTNPVHISYTAKQNLLLKKNMRLTEKGHPFVQRMIRYFIIFLAKLIPNFMISDDLAPQDVVEQVKHKYKEDWEKCLSYPALKG